MIQEFTKFQIKTIKQESLEKIFATAGVVPTNEQYEALVEMSSKYCFGSIKKIFLTEIGFQTDSSAEIHKPNDSDVSYEDQALLNKLKGLLHPLRNSFSIDGKESKELLSRLLEVVFIDVASGREGISTARPPNRIPR